MVRCDVTVVWHCAAGGYRKCGELDTRKSKFYNYVHCTGCLLLTENCCSTTEISVMLLVTVEIKVTLLTARCDCLNDCRCAVLTLYWQTVNSAATKHNCLHLPLSIHIKPISKQFTGWTWFVWSSQPPSMANRFCIEVDLFSVSAISLSRLKLWKLSTRTVGWPSASLYNFISA
jgi:hypothetical protein